MLTAFFLFPVAETWPAEPTPAIKYLMNEPVTMFDWGMYKLALYLNQDFRDRYQKKISSFAPRITVHYDANSNKIQISAVMLFKKFASEDEAKTYCTGVITYIRRLLVFKQGSAKSPVPPTAPLTTLGSYFGQYGKHHKNKLENIEKELSKSTELVTMVMDKFDQPVIGKASLLGSGIEFLYGPHKRPSQTVEEEGPDAK
jgi:hypothetical protein